MARECAFCPATAKLSAEHLWSDWMNALISPGRKRFISRDEKGAIKAVWQGTELDWKAKVVCKPCNETWMSKIESQHAQPAMADLIRGHTVGMITQSRASSIALFAFKTAVIFDCIRRNHPSFFLRSVRHGFKDSLTIPISVNMWMAHFALRGKGGVVTWYHEGQVAPTGRFELYSCTYSIEHFVFQVVAEKPLTLANFIPLRGYEELSVKFWPHVAEGVMWPPSHVMQTSKEVYDFSRRWRVLNPGNPTRK
jgi:hypothetical protein